MNAGLGFLNEDQFAELVNSANIDGAGVSSFNTRVGPVTLASGDVTDALGYIPTSVTSLTGVQSVVDFKLGLSLVKADVGLGSVDNTADAAKNVLTATKLFTARNINGIAFDGSADITINAVDSTPRVPETRTIATTAPLTGGGDLSANRTFAITPASGAAAGSMSAADKTKLDGVATGATANSSDATLLARANHTGTQLASTISDFSTAADARVAAALGITVQPYDSDLNTIASLIPTTDNFLVAVSSAWASRTPAQVRTTLGLVVGTDVQAYDPDLTTWAGITPGTGVGTALGANIGSAGAVVTFNGAGGTPSSLTLTNATGLPISGLVASTSTALGVGSIELGHASDTTIARVSAGDISVEGKTVYRVDGTDVSVADGGTGRSTSTTAYGLIAAGTTATGAHQTLAAGATTEILVGGGTSALPVWTTATGTGAPVRAGSPTFSGTITAAVDVLAGSYAAGRIYKDGTHGVVIAGVGGSTNASVLVSTGGQIILQNPSGTNELWIGNGPAIKIAAGALGNYANDAAAATGGVGVGYLYRNGSVLMIRVA